MSRGKAERLVAERRAAGGTLEGVIFDQLQTRIVTLEYPPGHMIFENEIAAEFGVSRTPVRQAFFRLAMADLLEVLPQRGARVSYLSRDKVRESQEVREVLEVHAVAEAARKWSASDPEGRLFDDEIDRLIAAQTRSVEAKDYTAFTRLDEEFHCAIMRLAGNTTLLDTVSAIRAHLNRIRYVELQVAHHDAAAIEHHRKIVEAIRANDPDRASHQMTAHLKMLEEFREEIFSKRDDMFV
ncbi:GntR family transcriptional regulator [Tropicimonas marinistellae]|uniref:GntR family transcriptional regulator n=1 Tax=Tropicimonas marinistellae TaxID=1739787 RepID=UPI00082DA1B2|nr:GntR family transcriptional regulator [Tropicimonas marinistellae]